MNLPLKPAVRIHRRIAELERADWDACAPSGGAANPFVSFDFLDALEQSGSVGDRTGWAPHHLSVEDEAGRVAAVMPLYLKSHSQGEYVFDWSWADAYERAGGRYYPKLQCASPFSP
ncbi:MAG TPA: peptidogalycan biosysnthesis protein, partial [Caulobacter sp.]|nr:peptidogalycan biosysnthesis protein [Caulobacter sp.]